MNKVIEFDMSLAHTKPESIRNREASCPFCDREHLTDIYETRGTMIWLKNKYPVLKDTLQTLIIESDICDSDFSSYTPQHAEAYLCFGLEKWEEMIRSGKFASVLFFRNYGPMSGGSIHHPHSQIVGLYHYDYHEEIKKEHCLGIPVWQSDRLEVNLSLRPISGFFEYNVVLSSLQDTFSCARFMQSISRFLIAGLKDRGASYNIFYYQFPGDTSIYIKLVPRYITNPIFIGYLVPQRGDQTYMEVIRGQLYEHFRKEGLL